MSRSVNDIAAELSATGLTQQQAALLLELVIVKTEEGAQPRARRFPLTTLPADWKPNEDHILWAVAHQKSRGWVESIAEDMRNWASSRGERRASWNGTMSTFMKRALEPRPSQQRMNFNGRPPDKMLGGGFA